MTTYAVADIQTDKIAYCGPSDIGAARRLDPGTCHGQGPDAEKAIAAALAQAERFRQPNRATRPLVAANEPVAVSDLEFLPPRV